MSQELSSPVPRKRAILPEGVVRAKDNTNDFSFTGKSVQAEAEHNMGYFLAELNNRNLELEDEVARQDKELHDLRRENHQLREDAMKVVTDVPAPALPLVTSQEARLGHQRQLLEEKDAELTDLRQQVDYFKGERDVAVKFLQESRDEADWLRERANTAIDDVTTLTNQNAILRFWERVWHIGMAFTTIVMIAVVIAKVRGH